MPKLSRIMGVALLAMQASQALAQSAADDVAIRELAMRWEHAWNQHDMKRLVSVMTEDADFVNVGARHWRGKREIEAEHASRLDQFRESTWSTKAVTIRLLEPDVALVHVDWALSGDKDPDGTPRSPRGGVFTWVVVRQSKGWLIRAAQNTNLGPLASTNADATHDAGPEALVEHFVRAWNAHDMAAFSRLYATDATWVTTFDTRDSGRDAIVADLRAAHESWAGASTVAASAVDVKLLRPDVAIVQFNLLMRISHEAQAVGRTLLLVASRETEGWRITAGQITKPNCRP